MTEFDGGPRPTDSSDAPPDGVAPDGEATEAPAAGRQTGGPAEPETAGPAPDEPTEADEDDEGNDLDEADAEAGETAEDAARVAAATGVTAAAAAGTSRRSRRAAATQPSRMQRVLRRPVVVAAPAATPTPSELAVRIDDRISAVFVIAVTAFYIAIFVYAIFLGGSGLLTPTPTPRPTASAPTRRITKRERQPECLDEPPGQRGAQRVGRAQRVAAPSASSRRARRRRRARRPSPAARRRRARLPRGADRRRPAAERRAAGCVVRCGAESGVGWPAWRTFASCPTLSPSGPGRRWSPISCAHAASATSVSSTSWASIPRERFVSDTQRPWAYADEALPIESGQTISQPYIVARMTELLAPRAGDRVLEVGTGSGYQAAVLAALGARVLSIERHAGLATTALRRLEELGLDDRVEILRRRRKRGRPRRGAVRRDHRDGGSAGDPGPAP